MGRASLRCIVSCVAFVGAVAVPTLAGAQAVIKGTLYDDAKGSPVGGGAVMLVDPGTDGPVVHTRTDSLGSFELSIGRSGSFQIAAVREGYTSMLSAPIPLVNGERLVIRIPIATSGDPQHNISVLSHTRPSIVQPLADQRAANMTQGHRSAGLGLIFDRARLESSTARNLADFLRTVPGISATDGDMDVTSFRMNRSPDMSLLGSNANSPAACHVGWFLDGRRIDHRGPGSDPIVDGLGSIPLEQLESVEVFRGVSEMPTDFFEPDLRCGAISLWLRR